MKHCAFCLFYREGGTLMAESIQRQVERILKRHHMDGTFRKQQEAILLREAQQLRSWINRFIALYYDSYTPKVYRRTYAFRNSLEMPEIVNGHIVIRFTGAMVRHQSLFGGGYGYVPSLINYGWRWKNQSVKPIHRFTYYEGDHFLEDAIHAYLSSTKVHVTIEVHDGSKIKETYSS